MKFLKFAIGSIALATMVAPAVAQNVDSGSEFIEAIRARDGNKATEVLSAHPNVIDAKDGKGDTALVIAVGRSDDDYTAFLLSKGADPNKPGNGGNTPLITAARNGFGQGVAWLLGQGAKVDGTNRMGETALIVAVQQRQTAIVRALLAAGANPDKTDNASGYSARDYAQRDNRSRDILRIIEATKPKPAAATR
jgi:ankyrin repeat protein